VSPDPCPVRRADGTVVIELPAEIDVTNVAHLDAELALARAAGTAIRLVSESTGHVLGARRMRALQELAASRSAHARGAEDVARHLSARLLGDQHDDDVAFLVYRQPA